MPRERRSQRKPRDPDRRYGDRRLALGFRKLVEGLVEKGEIEVVETMWGREFHPKPPATPPPAEESEEKGA
jgi:hypothetical protein